MVSIIVPSFNHAHFLASAIDSVLNQTYKNFECIIVDDGSTDATSEVAASYTSRDLRVKYIYQQNGGLAAARNYGLKFAQGKYIQFLDADDLLEPYKISRHVEYLDQHADVDVVFTDAYLFRDQTNIKEKFAMKIPGSLSDAADVLLTITTDNFFLVGCPLFRATILKETGHFEPSLRALEDWHFWYRFALTGKRFHQLNTEGTFYLCRSHGSNMSSSQAHMWQNKIKARLMLMDLLEEAVRNSQLNLSPSKISGIRKTHNTELALDELRYNSKFGSVAKGMKAAIVYAYHSNRFMYTLREFFYCITHRHQNG